MPKEKSIFDSVVGAINNAADSILDVDNVVPEVSTHAEEVEEPSTKPRSKRGTFVSAPKAQKVNASGDDDGDDGDDGDDAPEPGAGSAEAPPKA